MSLSKSARTAAGAPPRQGWRVVHVFANHEKRVAQHLSVRSLEHYLPLYPERSQWSDRVVDLERPLFPGYLFTRFSPDMRLAVLTTPGVVNVIGNEWNGVVAPAEIERIREALAEGYTLRPHAAISRGTRVRVAKGIFSGVEGVVAELRHDCKVVLAIAPIEHCFSLEIALSDLEPLGPEVRAAARPCRTARAEAMA